MAYNYTQPAWNFIKLDKSNKYIFKTYKAAGEYGDYVIRKTKEWKGKFVNE